MTEVSRVNHFCRFLLPPRENPFATSCTAHLLPPSRPGGRRYSRRKAGDCPCVPLPENWACHGRPPENMPWQRAPYQAAQRQGAGQGRGPGSGSITDGRRLTRVTYSLFKTGDGIAGQQYILSALTHWRDASKMVQLRSNQPCPGRARICDVRHKFSRVLAWAGSSGTRLETPRSRTTMPLAEHPKRLAHSSRGSNHLPRR